MFYNYFKINYNKLLTIQWSSNYCIYWPYVINILYIYKLIILIYIIRNKTNVRINFFGFKITKPSWIKGYFWCKMLLYN